VISTSLCLGPARPSRVLIVSGKARALAAIGGVPRLIVPGNAKVAVIKACLYERQVNRTYAGMAAHYGTAVLPTKPPAERQGQVETCLLIVDRWLIGRLRDRRFCSLAELLKHLNEEHPILDRIHGYSSRW
jgi:transposase